MPLRGEPGREGREAMNERIILNQLPSSETWLLLGDTPAKTSVSMLISALYCTNFQA
jgi:hypothetical protein